MLNTEEITAKRHYVRKPRAKTGFTLAELLIVVAIIAVLVAIAIPIFTRQLERSREATDLANCRDAYAELVHEYLANGESTSVSVKCKQSITGWNYISGIIGTNMEAISAYDDIDDDMTNYLVKPTDAAELVIMQGCYAGGMRYGDVDGEQSLVGKDAVVTLHINENGAIYVDINGDYGDIDPSSIGMDLSDAPDHFDIVILRPAKALDDKRYKLTYSGSSPGIEEKATPPATGSVISPEHSTPYKLGGKYYVEENHKWYVWDASAKKWNEYTPD